MTTDERLEKLTERVDAIAQSLELLVSLQRTTETRLQSLIGHVQDLTGIVNNIGTATENLIPIVHNHELRIDALERN